MSKLISEPFQWVKNKIEIAIIKVDKFLWELKISKKNENKILYLLFSRISGIRQNYLLYKISIRYNPKPIQLSLYNGYYDEAPGGYDAQPTAAGN